MWSECITGEYHANDPSFRVTDAPRYAGRHNLFARLDIEKL